MNSKKFEFVELRAAGATYSQISEKLNVSKPTLISWAKELAVELENARTLARDVVFNRFAAAADARAAALCEIHTKIQSELQNRDWSGVPTAKLLELYERIGSVIRSELVTPPTFCKAVTGIESLTAHALTSVTTWKA